MRRPSSSCHRLATLLLLPLVALLWPAHATAQQGWSGEVVTLSAPEVRTTPNGIHIAADAAGNTIAIWIQGANPNSENAVNHVQTARLVAATQTWTAPSIRTTRGGASQPAIASDPAGNAVAVWRQYDGTTFRIQAARYLAATDTWTGPVDLSTPDGPANSPVVGLDRHGNAVVLWARELSITEAIVEARRMESATGTWAPVVALTIGEGFTATIDLDFDAEGNAMVVYTQDATGARWARYLAASDAWVTPGRLPEGYGGKGPRVQVEAGGTAIAVWADANVVHAARFDPARASWLLPAILTGSGAAAPRLALNAAGEGLATWVRYLAGRYSLEVMRYSPSTRTWIGPAVLPVDGFIETLLDADVDEAGNALIVWTRGYGGSCPQQCLQALRYVAATDTWTLIENLSTPTQVASTPSVKFDGSGNAVVAWGQRLPQFASGGYLSAVQARTWRGTPLAPTITDVSASSGTLTLAFTPPTTSEPGLAPANYAYSVDDGLTWTTRDPAAATSPLDIHGLVDGRQYAVRLRAINPAGAGAASEAIATVPGAGPSAPSSLIVTNVAGSVVSLGWMAPAAGIVPTGYVLEGGINPGEVLASVATDSAAPMFTFTAPSGIYFVRVRATAGSARSAPSNDVRLVVNAPAVPSAPAHLLATVNGSTVSLSWTNTFAGGAPSSLWLSVTGDLTATLPLSIGESFTAAGVPAGSYTVRVVAVNAAGISTPSNAVTLTVPSACALPDPPTGVQAWTIGRTVAMSWNAPSSGAAVTGYTVHVSGSYAGSFDVADRQISGAAAPGTYTLSVVARNPCGAGAPSVSRTIGVP